MRLTEAPGRMVISGIPFSTVDWSQVAPSEHGGKAGMALIRSSTFGDIRVRQVDYSPGYVADAWCRRGHVLLVLEGELQTELEDGRRFVLPAGSSYQVAEGPPGHRSSSPRGARLFIVD
jgi:quercetin dioxygenase-like cupin family protein